MSNLIGILSDPQSWLIIGWLVVLEGLLSADNALVLAILVKDLPPEQRNRALKFGIFGAYFFRFVAIGVGTILVKLWYVKLIGGLYLLNMARVHFFSANEPEDTAAKYVQRGFWMTVATVELMDITFSVDSILAAFGVSEQTWVLFLGGVLGITAMRFVATLFVKLLEKFPEFGGTAFVLIALIGGKLTASAFGVHINDTLFFGLLGATFLGTFLIHKINVKRRAIVGE
jgi:YkoY family integral membrane protein